MIYSDLFITAVFLLIIKYLCALFIKANDNIEDVDKFNVLVRCAGKTMDIDVFPLERIAVLLENACQQAGKKCSTMKLVYNGRLSIHMMHPYELKQQASCLFHMDCCCFVVDRCRTRS